MPLPPVAARVLEYEEPTSPPGRDDVVTESAELMTIDRLAELAVSLLESVTLNTSPEDVPAVVGVPEMTPAELRLRPAGRVPLVWVQVSEPLPPVAARVVE